MGKKEIGKIFQGSNYSVDLISGELKLCELASGEVVSEVRKYTDEIAKRENHEITIIDAAAGVGCPVIASIVGSDFVVAVTEPTPSALHDLKRLLYLSKHFKIPRGIVINKWNLAEEFCRNIEDYAQEEGVKIIGKIPYHKDFMEANLKMSPLLQLFPKYTPYFDEVISVICG